MDGSHQTSRRGVSLLATALAFTLTVAFGCNNPESPQPGPAEPTVTASPAPQTPPTLHAWANPIKIAGLQFADHTFVTTYDVAVHCPPPTNYWYSWGSCHEIGPGTPARLLVDRAADVAVAKCICTPDLLDYLPTPGNPAHGGIDYYGISGVCHQLSNRILWATGAEPLTVSDAMGYGVSRYLYGEYGRDTAEWAARIQSCTAAAAPSPASGTPVAAAMVIAPARSLESDLVAMVQDRLGSEVSRAKTVRLLQIRTRLLAEKAPLDRAVRSGEMPPAEFANRVNELVNKHLRDAAETLTPEEYQRLFGIPKGMVIGIVDPTIAEKSSYRPR